MSRTLRAVVLGLSFTAFAVAHHSTATAYNMDQPATLRGTVAKVEWQNPHIWCYIDVTDGAENVTKWEVEIQANPNAMFRRGWTKDRLRIGDVVRSRSDIRSATVRETRSSWIRVSRTV